MGKWKELAGIHTCHADCQRPACIAVREAYEAGRKDENEEIAVEFDKRHEAVKHRNNYFLHAANYVRARREQ